MNERELLAFCVGIGAPLIMVAIVMLTEHWRWRNWK